MAILKSKGIPVTNTTFVKEKRALRREGSLKNPLKNKRYGMTNIMGK